MSEADLQLPYGLASDGRLVPVSQTERGLACDCRCPKCDRRLIAKKGEVVRHHFAHGGDLHCVGAYETMAHRLAKQIIADAGWVYAPVLRAIPPARHDRKRGARPRSDPSPALARAPSGFERLELADVRLEAWQDGFRPDIFAANEGAPLVIEVLVTHACTPEKLAMIAERALTTLEIDLSDFRSGFPSEAAFAGAVLSGGSRTWLFHPRQADLDASLAAELAEHERQRRERVRREHLARVAAARESYLRERDTFEREAIEYLGATRAAKWATEDNYVSMKLDPLIGATGDFMDWRLKLREMASRSTKLEAAESSMAERAAELQAMLANAAIRHFRSEQMAQLWLRTTNPAIARHRPISFCVDEQSYAQCVDALARR